MEQQSCGLGKKTRRFRRTSKASKNCGTCAFWTGGLRMFGSCENDKISWNNIPPAKGMAAGDQEVHTHRTFCCVRHRKAKK